MAEWIKFSVTELELFCKKYEEEEKKETEKVIGRSVLLGVYLMASVNNSLYRCTCTCIYVEV